MKQGTNQARPVPVPPGGGSWIFDEVKWEWVSNEPASTPQEPAAVAAEVATSNTKQEP